MGRFDNLVACPLTHTPIRHVRRSPASRLRQRDLKRLARSIVAIFLQGLVGLLPLIVTVVVLGWLGYAIERVLGTAILYAVPEAWYLPGMGLAAGVIVIFGFGLIINLYGVPRLIHLAECIIGRVPLVKTIYGAVRDLLGFFGRSGHDGAVSQVVVVSFGDTGIKAVGLLMRETYEGLPEGLGGEGEVVVYFPQSYQLGGMLLLVPRANIRPLDMDLEDALRFIVTGGAKSRGSDECNTPEPARKRAPPADTGGPRSRQR